MKVVRLNEDVYKKAEKLSKTHRVKVNTLISQALDEGLEAVNEKAVLELYRDRKITLQKAAEMLSTDIWDMIERLKKTDIHIDYSKDDLAEDLK
jgi:predicted HTH domain antitoxin